MGRTIMGAAVSQDGYLTQDDNEADHDFDHEVYSRVGAMVIGRRLFDRTDGWGGVPAAGDHVFVVTHTPPADWKHAGTAPFTFVTDGVEAAIARARELAGADRDVAVAAGEVGAQALRLGLIDQVVMNVVPVVLGSGRPFFDPVGPNLDLFAGIPVDDFATALAWYEKLFGSAPAFFPNDIEAVWQLAESRWVYIKRLPERAGHAEHTVFVDDLDDRVAGISGRGLEPAEQETYDNGVRKIVYRDPEGNELGFGGGPS
jgi:dihydrofolate reductase